MARELTLEAEEWYVLRNWLRSRENRLMYALRSRSREWEAIYELRRTIETQCADRGERGETTGAAETVTLSDAEADRLLGFLRRRALLLRLAPWRDRERRDVVHLRRRLLDQS